MKSRLPQGFIYCLCAVPSQIYISSLDLLTELQTHMHHCQPGNSTWLCNRHLRPSVIKMESLMFLPQASSSFPPAQYMAPPSTQQLISKTWQLPFILLCPSFPATKSVSPLGPSSSIHPLLRACLEGSLVEVTTNLSLDPCFSVF